MNILAFFAHPDDETMLAGGTLALLAKRGANVHYVCATRGEGGEVGEPPVSTIEALGETREKELVCAVQALGGKSLTFLGYTDPRVGPNDELFPFTENITVLGGQVAASIRQFKVDAVFSHGSNGEYGHPAHILCHKAAYAAVLSFDEAARPLFYAVSASYPEHPYPRLTNQDNPAHFVIDAKPVLAEKTAAAMCQKSQHALFVRRRSEEAGRRLSVPEVILDTEGIHRIYPKVHEELTDPVAALLTDPLNR